MILQFDDVVLTPQKCVVASRNECDTTATLGKNTFAVPVVAANMKSILTKKICKQFDKENWFYVYHRINGVKNVEKFVEYANDKGAFNVVSISVGIKPEWVKFVRKCKNKGHYIDYFTVDVAHSHTENVLPILRAIREHYPDAYVICGNGCTKEWVQWLESYNLVDCIKVGIGVSKACRTREHTGFGSSTLGSLIECVEASNDDIMSDGGHQQIGDIAKAIAFGADWVMSGGLFAKCIDSPAVVNGYYGNASRDAKGNDHVEGENVKVETNGLTIKEQMKLIQESLRSSISYAGKTDVGGLYKTPYQIAADPYWWLYKTS